MYIFITQISINNIPKLKQSVKYSIASATFSLAIISIVSKGFGFLREIVYANSFGLSKEFDLYLVSAAIPFTVNTAVLYIAQHYFVPSYHKIKKQSEVDASKFFSDTFYQFITGGIFFSLLLGFLTHPVIQLFISTNEPVKFELVKNLFRLFLITIPLNAGVAVLSAYLQSEYKLILPAIMQLLLNLIIIVSVIFLSDKLDVYVLPLSFVLSNLLILIILSSRLKAHLKIKSARILKVIRSKQSQILLMLIVIELVSLSYSIIDRYFYHSIPDGGISALNYAFILFSMPVSTFTIALITAIFPRFSETAIDNKEELISSLLKSISINVFLMIPITMVFLYFGYDLIKLFYEHGRFTDTDSNMTQSVLQFYAISLVFYSTYLISIKLLYSIAMHKWVLIFSIMGFTMKIILNLLFVDTYQQNGLAFSTTLVFISLYAGGIFISANKLNYRLNLFAFKKILLNLLNGALVLFIINILVENIRSVGIVSRAIGLLLFIFLYLLNSYIFKSEDYLLARKFIRNYLPIGGSRK